MSEDREEARLFLEMLRAAGVAEWDGKLPPWTGATSATVRVRFAVPAARPPSDDDRPVPKAPKSLDEKLLGPLAIGKRQ